MNLAEKGHVYDIYPFYVCYSFSDPVQAMELKAEITTECDQECREKGTQWSFLFMFNGIVLLLLCITYLLIAFGAKYFRARIIGSLLNIILLPIYISSVVIIACYRFSKQGKLAALCQASAHFEDDHEPMSALMTFERDGNIILGTWIC